MLEIVDKYKNLELDFHNKINWETCKIKILYGMKGFVVYKIDA